MTTTQITTDAFFERETQMTDKGQTTRHDRENAAMALFEAVGAGDVDEVARLLSEGTDADAWGWENDQGDRPLQAAARLGGTDGARIVEMLLDAGADIDFRGEYNATALHRAVYVDHEDGWATALSQAIRNHDPEAVAVLLAHGADPDLPISPEIRSPTAMQHSRGCASDGRRFGWEWAERAFEVERLMIEALDRDIQD